MNSPDSTISILSNITLSPAYSHSSLSSPASPESNSVPVVKSGLEPITLFSDLVHVFAKIPSGDVPRIDWPDFKTNTENAELAELRKTSEAVALNNLPLEAGIAPAKKNYGAIGNEVAYLRECHRKHAGLITQFQNPNIRELQLGVTAFNALSLTEHQEALSLLCLKWKDLSHPGKSVLLCILARLSTAKVSDRGVMLYFSISSMEKLFGVKSMQLLLAKLFRNSDEVSDIETIGSFFQNSPIPVTSLFTIALLKVMQKYPLKIQRELWESYFLKKYSEIEKNEKVSPFFNAYLLAASNFIAESLHCSDVANTGIAIYQGHLFQWKKHLSEVLISHGGLTQNDSNALSSFFHPELINYSHVDQAEEGIRSILNTNGAQNSENTLDTVLESMMVLPERRAVDLKINTYAHSLIRLGPHHFFILLKKIDRLNLTQTAILVLKNSRLSIKEEEQLLSLYFPSDNARDLLTIQRYQWEVVDLPLHSLRTLVHVYFRGPRVIPRFGVMDFNKKIALCHAFITVMSQLQFSMDDIRKNLLTKLFPENTLISLYNQSPRSYKRLLTPYCAALLYNQRHDECAKTISVLLDTPRKRKVIEMDGGESIVNELETLQLHALAINGPSKEVSELFDKILTYIQADANRIYSVAFTDILSIARQIGKSNDLEAIIRAKMGRAPLSMESISWMGYQDQIPKDSTGVEFLHEKILEAYVPNNLPFIILKISLLLHLKQFEEATTETMGYQALIPEYPFDYLFARTYLDPSYPNKTDTHLERVNTLLNRAFLKNPKWIDISIASWLLNCQNSRLGISKEEFCNRISFYEHSRFSEVLHLIKTPYEKPLAFANRLENLIKVNKIAPYEILSCFSKTGKNEPNIPS